MQAVLLDKYSDITRELEKEEEEEEEEEEMTYESKKYQAKYMFLPNLIQWKENMVSVLQLISQPSNRK